jgi:hypothetical protein
MEVQMPQQEREFVGARIDRGAMNVVRRVAEIERRSISGVVRNVLADWADSQVRRLRLEPASDRSDAA